MNKIKKAMTLITVCAMTVSSIPTAVVSVNAAETDSEEVSTITQKIDDLGRTVYYDNNGNEISVESLNDDSVENKSYPSKYDLRNYDRITSVKNQGADGYCWAFASTACIESNILTNPELCKKIGENPSENLDLSETGTSWFIMTGIQDKNSPYYNDYYRDASKGSNGGNSSIIPLGLNCGFGTYPEEIAPYSNALSGYSEYFRYYSDYHLKDFNVLSDDINTLKDNIMNNGAIGLSYNNADSGYSLDKTAYYVDSEVAKSATGGHEVTVAGWDDDYSRDNFTGAVKPENDGAWLCKNSWGASDENDGYIWISYETFGLDFAQYIMQDNSEYDNEYQNGFNFSSSKLSANVQENANIFTANTDEEITQVSFGSMSAYNYEISVYKLNDNFTSPVDGTLLTAISGKVDNVGIHYIDLPDNVFVESGDNFSVIVKGDKSAYITYDGDNQKQYVPRKGYYKTKDDWKDTVDSDFGYSSIKAFTKNVDNTNVKSLLENAIFTAENMEISADVDKKYVDELNSRIDECKKILNTENVCAGDINNAMCFLNYSIGTVSNAVYIINGMDDYVAFSEKLYNGEIRPDKIILNTDLDFDNNLIKPLSNFDGTFSCNFIGNGHTIKNAEIDTITTIKDVEINSFFGILQSGSIKDLNFENITCNGAPNSAIVSTIVRSSVLDNISVDNCTIKMNSAYEFQQSAGICGGAVSVSVIKNCEVKNTTLYGSAVYEISNDIGDNFADNSVSNNELHSYQSINLYDSASNSVRTICVIISENVDSNIVLEKSKNDTVRFRKFTDREAAVFEDSVSYTKQGDWNYVDLEKSGDYAFVKYTPDKNRINEKYWYAIDFDTYNGLLKKVNLSDSDASKVTFPEEIDGQAICATTANLKFQNSCSFLITDLTIPDSYTEVSPNTFKEMYSLQILKLGNGIKEIYDSQFKNKRLTSVELGNSIEKIGSEAFQNCSFLKTIVIPDSVKKIGDNAFLGDSFNKITFGKNVSEIGEFAFGYSSRTIAWENNRYAKIPSVVINGYAGTAAEEYAKNNGFSFNNLEENEPDMNQKYRRSYDIQAGDIDLDGEITVKDVTLLQKYIVDSESLNDFQLIAASVKNAPDSLSVTNVTCIQKYIAHIYDNLQPKN